MKDKEKQLVNEIKQDFKMQEEKHKQIEEIAKDIHIVCTACSGEMFDEYTCDRCQAKLLIKKGYRKLPEDSVVLSREEYENKKIIVEMSGGHKLKLTIGKFGEMSKVLEEYTRKETAEKIYTKIKDSFLMNSNNRYALKLWIEEQFGLEIKE